MCLEVGAKLLDYHKEGQSCLLEEDVPRDLLMKNIGLCFLFSSSLNKAALTETSDIAR